MSKDNGDDAVDYMHAPVDAQGVCASTVSDGHVLMFKRSFLQAILDKNPDHEKLIIFVKRSDFKD